MEAAVRNDQKLAARALGHFADFCKALAIYPEANSRVRGALEQFMAAVKEAGPVRLAIPLVGEDDDPLAPNLAWLRDRFERSGLAAIVLPGDVPEDSIRAVGRRLLRNFVFNRKASRFEDLWPEPIEAVTLRPRMFVGQFDGADELGGQGDGSATSGAKDGVAVGGSDDDEETPLGSALWQRVRDQVDEEYAGIAHDAGDELCRQFLERVVDTLPTELAQSQALREQACDRLVESVSLDPMPTEAALGAMLVSLHRDMTGGGVGRGNHRDTFTEMDEPEEKPSKEEPKRKKGHAGDDKIVDDRETFDEELARLPAGRTRPLTLAETQVRAEQIDVLLHYVLQSHDATVRERLHRLGKRLLTELGPEENTLLGGVLKQHWFRADEVPNGPRARLMNLLSASGHARLLRDLGVLTEDYVVDAFPQDFILYLDCLDIRRPPDRAALASACRRLTPSAIASAGPTLMSEGQLLESHRRDTLLGIGDASLIPFARLLFAADAEGTRGAVVRYLSAVHGPDSLAATLVTLDAGGWVPTALVSRLLELETGATPDFDLLDEAARAVVGRMHADGASRPDGLGRRIACIGALGRIRTDRSRSELLRLRRARRWLFLPAEPKEVRAAAAAALAVQAGGLRNV